MDPITISAKLSAPSINPLNLVRHRLLEKLESRRTSGSRISVISAPPGYGKTTLAVQWLKASGEEVAWLTLDKDDNDIVRFANCLVQSINKAMGCMSEHLQECLVPSGGFSLNVVVSKLLNVLSDISKPIFIVLDDFHLISNHEIQQCIQLLAEYLPISAHLVIISRESPPLPLSKYRARRQLTEISAADLQFSGSEIGEFFKATSGISLNERSVEILERKTEGWVAGLQLASYSMQDNGQAFLSGFIDGIDSCNKYVMDYLIEEVLQLLKPYIRDFLYKTSILDSFSCPLCERLTGRTDSKEILDTLTRSNLFLIPLDEKRQWYRYHPLFADILKTFTKDEPILHETASIWYKENSMPFAAVRHAIASGNIQLQIDLLQLEVEQVFLRGEISLLLQWLNAMDENVLSAFPNLMAYKAWCMLLSGNIKEAVRISQAFQDKDLVLQPFVYGMMSSLKASLYSFREDPQAVPLAEEALKYIPEEYTSLRILTMIPLGKAYRGKGCMKESTDAFRKAYTLSRELNSPMLQMGVLTELIFNLSIQGQLQEAISLCNAKIEEYDKQNVAGTFYILLGILLYQCDRLDEAESSITAGVEMNRKFALNVMLAGDGEITLALVYYAKGEKDKAFHLIRKLRSKYGLDSYPLIALRVSAYEAYFHIKEDQLKEAQAWAYLEQLSAEDVITSQKELAYCIYAELLIKTKKYSDARIVLGKLEDFARSGGRNGRLILILLLCSKLEIKLGRSSAAGRYLEEAVSLSASSGYKRPLMSMDDDLVGLLKSIKTPYESFIKDVLSSRNGAVIDSRQPSTVRSLEYMEPLSDRELEILKLIATGFKNREIAGKLYITEGTAKWHINNIFTKLQVNNRSQATAKARKLGFI